MAKRQQAKRMAAQGASAAKIQQKTGVSKQAANRMTSKAAGGGGSPMQIQQAPYPETFIKNPPPVAAQYIPGLMVPGNVGYRPEYGGGGWAAGLSEYDGAGYNSVNDIKDWYKAMAFTGNKALGVNKSDIEWAARQYDAGNLGAAAPQGGGSSAPSGGGGGPSPARANLGTGNRISRGRIQSIMDQKGIKGSDRDRASMRITNRLVQRGGTLGLGAARDYAKAYAERNPQEAMMQSMTGQKMRVGSSGMTRTIGSPANDMSSRKGQKGALYRGIQSILDAGNYAKGDVLASLRSGDVRAQPFGTGGGMGAGGKGRKGKRKGKGDTTMGADMGTTAMDQIQPMDMEPMAPEQMAEEPSININMPTVGDLIGNWASGFKTKRSSRRRAGLRAQGLSSQTVAPTGNWRYGT